MNAPLDTVIRVGSVVTCFVFGVTLAFFAAFVVEHPSPEVSDRLLADEEIRAEIIGQIQDQVRAGISAVPVPATVVDGLVDSAFETESGRALLEEIVEAAVAHEFGEADAVVAIELADLIPDGTVPFGLSLGSLTVDYRYEPNVNRPTLSTLITRSTLILLLAVVVLGAGLAVLHAGRTAAMSVVAIGLGSFALQLVIPLVANRRGGFGWLVVAGQLSATRTRLAILTFLLFGLGAVGLAITVYRLPSKQAANPELA